MKKINIGVFLLLLLLSISAFAGTPPDNGQVTFRKMYPKANDIAWSQDDVYKENPRKSLNICEGHINPGTSIFFQFKMPFRYNQ